MENKILISLFIFFILTITVFKSKFKGDIGEIAVAYKLKELDKSKYVRLHDIKLKNASQNTGVSQIDHLVISVYGIFCIETKAYKGKIYGKEFQRQWTQYLSTGSYRFMNPLYQNYGHIKSVEAILKDTYPDIPYFSIVTFSGEANLESIDLSKAYVCKISELTNLINRLSKNEVLSSVEVKNIVKIIEDNTIIKTNFAHNRDIKKKQKENKNKINANICPQCGGDLVIRNGKYGVFKGCANFPKCRFVANIK